MPYRGVANPDGRNEQNTTLTDCGQRDRDTACKANDCSSGIRATGRDGGRRVPHIHPIGLVARSNTVPVRPVANRCHLAVDLSPLTIANN